MKILALSDEVVDALYGPGILELARGVELVVGCGDVPFFYLEYVVTMLNVPLYYVPGNHDAREQIVGDGRTVTGAQGCENLDGRVVCEKNLILAGLGGSIRYRPDGVHQYTQEELAWRAMQLAPRLWWNHMTRGRALDVLVTHSPPLGIHDADDPAHIGFRALLGLMRQHRPRFLLHGHSHVYRQDTVTRTRFEHTEVVNVYPYRILDVGANHGG